MRLTHAAALNRIRLAISDFGGISLPITVGVFQRYQDPDSRPIKIGQPGTPES